MRWQTHHGINFWFQSIEDCQKWKYCFFIHPLFRLDIVFLFYFFYPPFSTDSEVLIYWNSNTFKRSNKTKSWTNIMLDQSIVYCFVLLFVLYFAVGLKSTWTKTEPINISTVFRIHLSKLLSECHLLLHSSVFNHNLTFWNTCCL